ncbi:MAG: spore protease YyaC [Clostridia bacterium]|nr:spore protease YyaC [Clostridia bacterium]
MDKNFKEYTDKLKSELNVNKNIIFLCIGTDRVIGDCLGPITGSLLKNVYSKDYVYGDLDENLTFENIEEKVDEIYAKFTNPYVVAIDAALSSEENIGKFFVDSGGINFGEGLDKNRGRIGDLGIKVVVAKDFNDNEMNFQVLQNTRLSEIIKLSKKTVDGLRYVLEKNLSKSV